MVAKPLIVQPESVTDFHAFGEVLSVLLKGEQTAETLSVLFALIPLAAESAFQRQNRDVLFLVVDGRLSYFVNESWSEVEAGGLVYLPRGSLYAYRNIGITPAHHWFLSSPAGLEHFFEECATEFARPGGPDLNRLMVIGLEHGLELPDDFASAKGGRHEN